MTSKVDEKQVQSAVRALYAYIAKEEDSSTSLLEGEDYVHVIVALKKIPEKARVKPFRVALPHSLYQDKSICLFIKDDPKKGVKQQLAEDPVAGVDKVIGVTKLRKNYKQFKDRRELLSTYDLFMTDERVLPMLPALLGKKFFEKKKQPVPVCLTKKNMRAELEKARDSTYFFLPSGSSCMVKVATTGMAPDQVCANIMGCLDGIMDHIPKKWKNVQALYLRTSNSVALPFFNSLPTVSKINMDEVTPAPAKKGPAPVKRKRGLSAPAKKPAAAKKQKPSTPAPTTKPTTAKKPPAKKAAAKKTPAKKSVKKTPAKK